MTSVYEDRSELAETLSSSDSTSNKSEDSDILREQAMFLWNKNYEVLEFETACCCGTPASI